MSARNLFPVAAVLTAPVAPELPATSTAGLLARAVASYRRLRRIGGSITRSYGFDRDPPTT